MPRRAARGEARDRVQRRARGRLRRAARATEQDGASRAPKLGRPRKISAQQAVEAMRRIDEGERATAVAAALGVSSATLFRALYHHRAVKVRKKKASAAETAAPRGAVFGTFAEAIEAYHLEAHEERDALIAGLDGVRDGLDAAITALRRSPEFTDGALEALREALVPVQRVLDAALKKIVRPPEFPPCRVLIGAVHSAARHTDRDTPRSR